MKKFEKKIHSKKARGDVNVRVRKFGGIEDLVRYIEHTSADDGFSDVVNGTRELTRDFNGATSYEEARETIKKGVNIKDIMTAINTGSREYNKKQNARHISGGAPCVPAVVANDPRAMYQKRREQITGAYNVYVNCGYNCGVAPQEVKEAGIKILKEVLRISAIKPVNMYVGATAIDNERKNVIGYGMQIMDAGKSFNAARVSYALTEAGFLRVFGFAMYARSEGMWSCGNEYTLGSSLVTYDAELNRKVLDGAYKNMLFVNIAEVIKGEDGALAELEAVK